MSIISFCPLTTLYNSELCIWCRDMFIVILKLFAYKKNNFVASLAAVLSNLIKPLKTKLNSLCCSISTVKIRKSTLCHHTPVTNSRYYWEPILPCNAPKFRGRKERRRNILAKAKFVVLAVEEKYGLLQTEVSVCFALSRIFNSLILLLLLFVSELLLWFPWHTQVCCESWHIRYVPLYTVQQSKWIQLP